MYRQILVGLDSTAAARAALDEVVEFAQANRATLTLVTVVPPVPRFIWAADVQKLRADAEREAKQLLNAAVARIPENVSVRTQLRHGKPGPELVLAAEEHQAQLIVLGSRARGRAASSLLGSVGAYAHFHSPLPLMVIKAPKALGDSEADATTGQVEHDAQLPVGRSRRATPQADGGRA